MPLTTVLLDLDDTLLYNNVGQFIPRYLECLGAALSEFAPPRELVSLVLRATGAMQANQDPAVTNREAFYRHFMPALRGAPDDIHAAIDRFYRESYPDLRQYVTPHPQAPALIKRLLAEGYAVVIATNPLFPHTAVEQRMDWAGVLNFPYARITSMENSHYCKPNPDYYREILTGLNCPPEQALMVGDDSVNDIAPARALGLKTWWITDTPNVPADNPPGGRGTLLEFYNRAVNGNLNSIS